MDVSRGKAETYLIRDLLHLEIETEISKTRRLFEALPDGKSDFKPYEKSMTLGRLAGHTTDLFRLITLTLTSSELDMALAWQPYTMAGKAELLARFEENASGALTAFRETSDEAFHELWTIKRGPNVLFSGDRFTYFRNQGINQIVSSPCPTRHVPSRPWIATTWHVWPLCRRNLVHRLCTTKLVREIR